MGELNLNNASASDLTNVMTDYSVDTAITDGAGEQAETDYINNNWSQQLGYFKNIPELNAAINAMARWTIGKGFKSDEITTMLLDTIRGWGKDTFNTILENMIRTYYIGGDSFCEIIRDDEGNLINLKPLDPGVMKIIAGRNGVIKRYEQLSKTKNKPKKFKTEDILHFARNRIADEIHGSSVIDPVENIILARNEAIEDYKIVMHRNVYPRMIFHLDTDDTTKIATFKKTMDDAYKYHENLYIPKDAVVPELLAVAPNATLDPKAWIEQQGDYFYEAVGIPQIILGGSGEFTEASAKIAYLAFQQIVEEEQLFLEEQILAQLNLVLELEFPVSLENEMLSDERKDGDQTETKPSETTAGQGQ